MKKQIERKKTRSRNKMKLKSINCRKRKRICCKAWSQGRHVLKRMVRTWEREREQDSGIAGEGIIKRKQNFSLVVSLCFCSVFVCCSTGTHDMQKISCTWNLDDVQKQHKYLQRISSASWEKTTSLHSQRDSNTMTKKSEKQIQRKRKIQTRTEWITRCIYFAFSVWM